MNPNSAFLGERTHLSRVYADGGGAARFFTQFEGETETSAKGRWPSNVVLEHAEGCKPVGTKRVKGSHAAVPQGEPPLTTKTYRTTDRVYGHYEPKATSSHVGLDGKETIEAWECVDGCPVKALDTQSGTLKSGKDVNPTEGPVSGFFGQTMPYYSKDANYGDEGGASRFFSQFDGVPFKYVAKANRKEAGCGEFEVQHITVKPLSLMRWLVKLVTRKGGTILDPYAGSGSTLHAAVLEGMHFIGMERDPESHAEAQKRLEIVFRKEEERKDAEESFEFSMGRG
jgi:site-specific DNA-methyltransferase (adenine-specific)